MPNVGRINKQVVQFNRAGIDAKQAAEPHSGVVQFKNIHQEIRRELFSTKFQLPCGRSHEGLGVFEASDKLALVDGSIADAATAARIAEVAKSKFGSIDALVNNAGIYF